MWWRESQTNKQQPSLFFDQWSDNNEVKDNDGNSQVLYHGTSHNFDSFQPTQHSSAEGYWGAGHYFTTSPEDASVNYAGVGADLSGRIEHRTEQIFNYLTDMIDSDEESLRAEYPQVVGADGEIDEGLINQVAQSLASKELYGGQDNVKPVYLRTRNPLNIIPSEATYFDHHESYDEDSGEYGEESGQVLVLREAIIEAADDYGFDGQAVCSEIMDRISPDEGIHADQVNKILRGCNEIAYAENEEGELINSQIVADIFRKMGYDSVVMNAYHHFGAGKKHGKGMPGITPDTRHYFTLDGSNVKSATGNNGVYDVNNPKITATVKPLSWYKMAQSIGGKVSPNSLINPIDYGPAEKSLLEQRLDPSVPNPEQMTIQEQLEGVRKQNMNNPNSPANGNGNTSSEGTSMASIEGAQGEISEKGGGPLFDHNKGSDIYHDNYPVNQSFAH